MKHIGRWLLWLVVVTFALIAVLLLFEHIPKSDTRDTFLGNLFATIIGLLVGVPIALEINRHQRATQEEQEKIGKEQERLNRKNRLLNLVRRELVYNRNLLCAIINDQKNNPKVVSYLGLKNDLWNALSDGEELHWIDDLELLDAIANAYYHIRRIVFLEDKYFDIQFNESVSKGERSTYAGESIVEGVTAIRPDAVESIEKALTSIEKHLNS